MTCEEMYRIEKAKRGLNALPSALLGPWDGRHTKRTLRCPKCHSESIAPCGSQRVKRSTNKKRVHCIDCDYRWSTTAFVQLLHGSRKIECRG